MEKLIILGADFTPAPCEYCGNVEELRPYGKGCAKICFDCGMLPENIKDTEASFDNVLKGNDMEVNNDQFN